MFVGYKIIDHARYNRYKARMQVMVVFLPSELITVKIFIVLEMNDIIIFVLQLSFKITANRDFKMSSPSAETNNVQNIQ